MHLPWSRRSSAKFALPLLRVDRPGSCPTLRSAMDAFESLMGMLLRRDGYWTETSVKVEMTGRQKRSVGRPSSPRWEVDLVAYKGSTNELLVVECKSFLDSTGVTFRHGRFEPPVRYKLFSEPRLRAVVMRALVSQLTKSGACRRAPKVRLCLATGKIATSTDRTGLAGLFRRNGWMLFDDAWVRRKLRETANAAYENDVALVVAKVLLRARPEGAPGFNVWMQTVRDGYSQAIGAAATGGTWSVAKGAKAGDLVLFYKASPDSCVADIFELDEDVRLQTAGWKSGKDWMAAVHRIARLRRPLRWAEIRRHGTLQSSSFVLANMQGRHCATEFWPVLKELILQRNRKLSRALRSYGVDSPSPA